MGDRLVAKWGMRQMEQIQRERRSLRRWLRGRIRNAEELRDTYREDGAPCSSAQEGGRADAFKAVLLVLDADTVRRKKVGK